MPLWVLFLAAQFVDILWSTLVLIGVEKVRLVPGHTASNPLALDYMPYSHSLTAAIAWAAILGFAGSLIWNRRGGVVIGLCVLAHWFLDLPVHVPDLPLVGNQHKVGLGLWDYPVLAFLLEAGLLLLAVAAYVRLARRTLPFWVFAPRDARTCKQVPRAAFAPGPKGARGHVALQLLRTCDHRRHSREEIRFQNRVVPKTSAESCHPRLHAPLSDETATPRMRAAGTRVRPVAFFVASPSYTLTGVGERSNIDLVSESSLTLDVHPWRDALYEELHSRPSPLVEIPCTISHIAVQMGHDAARGGSCAPRLSSATRSAWPRLQPGASCLYQTFGDFELRWESAHRVLDVHVHSKGSREPVPGASCPQLYRAGVAAEPTWKGDHGRFTWPFNAAEGPPDASELNRYFEQSRRSAGASSDRAPPTSTAAFASTPTASARVALQARDLTPLQAGRLVQRVLEIETYRLMALLALPVAREITPEVGAMERELARINEALTKARRTDRSACTPRRALQSRGQGRASALRHHLSLCRHERVLRPRARTEP